MIFHRKWRLAAVVCAAALCAAFCPRAAAAPSQRPNIVLITADDMGYNSVCIAGCRLADLTPNIDRLARQGTRFVHAHVTAAVCQPSRQAMMTGRYPHCNSSGGFDPIRANIPTLQEKLRAAGYMNGILGKVDHLAPQKRFCWDMAVGAEALGNGRDPAKYHHHTTRFIEMAREQGRPFFLMANSHDPHRPFAGSSDEAKPRHRRHAYPAPARAATPAEVQVPPFLPDLPEVRRELAQYYGSVHRCDQTVGEVLRAIDECGVERRTLVMFLSDNGMSFPYAKTNCYVASTRTPWIVRWPGHVHAGRVDRQHFVSGIDFMPTMLETAGLDVPAGLDGRSFLGVLGDDRDAQRDHAFTEINATSAGRSYPMRAMHTREYLYIFNQWADGLTEFFNEPQNGLTWAAMIRAGRRDADIRARVEFFSFRVPEELYRVDKDPSCLVNLAADAKHAKALRRMRQAMLAEMRRTSDPHLPALATLAGRDVGKARQAAEPAAPR